MRRKNSPRARGFLAAVALSTVALLAWLGAARADSPASSDEAETFVGQYQWTGQRESGRLDVFFVETAPAAYDVDFKFKFNGRRHTYSGTAAGSLGDGALEGTVFNENKRRSWVFRGEFEDGRFSGTHAEIRRTGERRSGTLEFSPRAPG